MEKANSHLTGIQKSISLIKFDAIVNLGERALQTADRIYAFAKNLADSGAVIEKHSQILGMTTTQYQQWTYAAKMAEVSEETLDRGMKFLSKSMGEVQTGAGKGGDALKVMGLSIKESSGHTKNLDEMMAEIADKFASWEEGPNKVAIALALFGRSGQELIPVLNLGKKGIEDFKNEAVKLNAVLGEDTVRALAQSEESFKRWESVWKVAKSETFGPLVEILGNVLERIIAIKNAWQGAPGFLSGIGAIYKNITEAQQKASIMGIGTAQEPFWKKLEEYERGKKGGELVPKVEAPPVIDQNKIMAEMASLAAQIQKARVGEYATDQDILKEYNLQADAIRAHARINNEDARITKLKLDLNQQLLTNQMAQITYLERIKLKGTELTPAFGGGTVGETAKVEAALPTESEGLKRGMQVVDRLKESLARMNEDELPRLRAQQAALIGDYETEYKVQMEIIKENERLLKITPEIAKAQRDITAEQKAQADLQRSYDSTKAILGVRYETAQLVGTLGDEYEIMLQMADLELNNAERLALEGKVTWEYVAALRELQAVQLDRKGAEAMLDTARLVSQGWTDYMKQIQTQTAETFRNAIPNMMRSFWDEFEGYLRTGKMNWKNFADSLTAQWAKSMRMQLETASADLLNKGTAALGKLFGLNITANIKQLTPQEKTNAAMDAAKISTDQLKLSNDQLKSANEGLNTSIGVLTAAIKDLPSTMRTQGISPRMTEGIIPTETIPAEIGKITGTMTQAEIARAWPEATEYTGEMIKGADEAKDTTKTLWKTYEAGIKNATVGTQNMFGSIAVGLGGVLGMLFGGGGGSAGGGGISEEGQEAMAKAYKMIGITNMIAGVVGTIGKMAGSAFGSGGSPSWSSSPGGYSMKESNFYSGTGYAYSATQWHGGKGPEEISSITRFLPRFHQGIGPDEVLSVIRKNESVLTPAQMKAVANNRPNQSISVGPIDIKMEQNKEISPAKLKRLIDQSIVEALKTYS